MKNNGFKPSTNGHSSRENSPGSLTFHDYLAIMFRSRWIIAITFLGVMAAVAFYTFTTPPTYQASTTIIVDEKKGMGQSLFDVPGFSQQWTLINNQVEILKSRSLSTEVIEQMRNSGHQDSLWILHGEEGPRKNRDILAMLNASIKVSPIRDTDLIGITVKAPSPFEAAYLANTVAQVYQGMDQDFGRGEITQVVKFLDEQLNRKEDDLRGSEETLKGFLENEKIASLSDEAAQIVEQGAAFESLYREALIDIQVTGKRLNYLKSKLGRSKETLEYELSRVSSPLIFQLRKELAHIERTIAVFTAQGVGESDPQVKRESQKLDAIKNRLTEETKKLIVDGLQSDDPLAQAQELVVKILEDETEMAAMTARADGLEKVVKSYTQKLESLPDKNVQLARLERNRKVDENLYMMMREKYEESRITQAGQIGKVRILDAAVPPIIPISPKKKLNLIVGFILGLGLGFALALLREYMDTSIRRIEDVEALDLTVLVAIPEMDADFRADFLDNSTGTKNGNGHSGPNQDVMRLVTHFKPKSPVSEAYRTLRTNLQFADVNNKIQTILVTSSGPGEGKSTTAANLAIAMSMQGAKTVLIDADMRRPVIHKVFEAEKDKGLSNILIGKLSIEDAVQPTRIQNLEVITSGILPPNPAEMMGSTHMKRFIADLKKRYDVLIFDTPPLIAVTDAAVLSKEMDGVLLVVKSGHTHKEAMMRGVDLLRNVRSRILGVLLNNVSRENTYGSYYYYYYYHYYDYYGQASSKNGKNDKKQKKKRKSKNEKWEEALSQNQN